MFNDSKYTKWYFKIINSAILRKTQKIPGDGNEYHHIIPKSLGGGNNKENLVLLTAKEHFIVHLLLIKMCISDKDKSSMLYALFNMKASNSNFDRKNNSRIYSYYKEEWQKMQSSRQKVIMSDPDHRKAVVEKRKLTMQNDPSIMERWKDSRIGKPKPHPAHSNARLKGAERSSKQKEASKKHSERMAGNKNRTYKCKQVQSKDMIFDSAYAAAEYYNVPYPTLAVWCAKEKNGFKYISGAI